MSLAVATLDSERTYGAFERTFRLSISIDANKIKATYNLGVLTITLHGDALEEPRDGGHSRAYDYPFIWRRISFLMDSGRDSASRPSGA